MFHDRQMQNLTAQQRTGNARISLLDVVKQAWDAKFWALGGSAIFAVACVAAVLLMKPSFESNAQVYIDPQDLQLLRNDLSPAPTAGDAGVFVVESQARIMQSDAVLRRVVETLGLTETEEFGLGGGTESSGLLGLSLPSASDGKRPPDPVQEAVAKLSKNIHVIREDRTYMIQVYGNSQSPERAADITNAVVDAYLELRNSQRSTQAGTASDGLEARLAELQQGLQDKENAIEEFRVRNDLVEANGSSLVDTRLDQANLAVSAAADKASAARVERDQLLKLAADRDLFLSSAVALSSPDISRLKGDLERAQASVSSLAVTLGERHPRLAAAQVEVEGLRRAIAAEIDRLTSSAELAVAQAEAEHDSALADLAELKLRSQEGDAARVRLRQLQRDADSARAIYEEALTRSRETREQGQVSTVNAQVISPATVPVQRKSPPPLSRVLPLGLILGFALGLGLGVLYNQFRQREPDQPAKAIPAPAKAEPPKRALPPRRQAPGMVRREAAGYER